MKSARLGTATGAIMLLLTGAAMEPQPEPQPAVEPMSSAPYTPPEDPALHPKARVMPSGTLIVVTPRETISSKHIETGSRVAFTVTSDVVENGAVVIPRGSVVQATVSWKTGRAIGGKSGKFELSFNSVYARGHEYALRGTHRQEGRGNTVGALLGSILISGRSAEMLPGQLVNVFTVDPIPY